MPYFSSITPQYSSFCDESNRPHSFCKDVTSHCLSLPASHPIHHSVGDRLPNLQLQQAKDQVRTGICEYWVSFHLSQWPVSVARHCGWVFNRDTMAVSILLLVTKLCAGCAGRGVRGQATTQDSVTFCQDWLTKLKLPWGEKFLLLAFIGVCTCESKSK